MKGWSLSHSAMGPSGRWRNDVDRVAGVVRPADGVAEQSRCAGINQVRVQMGNRHTNLGRRCWHGIAE